MGSSTVQARLDKKEMQTLRALAGRLGWSPSKAVREGLRLLAACYLGDGRCRVIGLGKFESGVADLGSNRRHLKDFGR